jgi:hypothetical protein
MRSPNLAHAALANQGRDFIRAEPSAGADGHLPGILRQRVDCAVDDGERLLPVAIRRRLLEIQLPRRPRMERVLVDWARCFSSPLAIAIGSQPLHERVNRRFPPYRRASSGRCGS